MSFLNVLVFLWGALQVTFNCGLFLFLSSIIHSFVIENTLTNHVLKLNITNFFKKLKVKRIRCNKPNLPFIYFIFIKIIYSINISYHKL